MISKLLSAMALFSVLLAGCSSGGNSAKKSSQENTFKNDRDFLHKWDTGLVVLSSTDGKGMVLVSPKYQGKVFTSTADGNDGKSFGWINYGTFEKEKDAHMNAFGGEDRLWLGPEGGPFSLFFAPGTEMVFDNWHTPPPIDTEEWQLLSSSSNAALLSKDMNLQNYAGTNLKLNISRKIEILEPSAIEKLLGISLDKISSVGFNTINTLKNTGDSAWDQKSGAPCMWNLDMFTPSAKTVIVVPYEKEAEGKVATTDYFGEIDSNRITIEDGTLYFKADGHSRGKLGLPPNRAKHIAGSYSADEGVLTITLFDINKDATYLNQEWTTKKDPFTGDAVNAYNDGPLANGTQMGPFYEIESVSPAAFLKPNEEIVHKHSVFHFTGDKNALDAISQKVLGVSLEKISSVFDKK
jgi:hypothetical protein